MVHGVGAVADDDAVDAAFDLFADGDCQSLVLLRPHVLREYSEEFFRREIADICQFRYGAIEFAWRKCGDYCAGAIIKTRRNCTAGAKQFYIRASRAIGEFLFRNFVVGFLVALLRHVRDRLGRDANVITGNQFYYDMAFVVVFAARKQDALELPARRFDLGLAPDAGVEFLQCRQRIAFVAFEQINHG